MDMRGLYTALITPFTAEDKIDTTALRVILRQQSEAGLTGVVVAGTTGESPTLSHKEHCELVATVVDIVKSESLQLQVVAGTGSNSTQEALAYTKHAVHAGVDAVMQVNPYYNRPTQTGLKRHMLTLADACDIPTMLYNIPSRSGVNMLPETAVEIGQHANVVAIKEASGNLGQASYIINNSDLAVFSGDDSLALPMMALGAVGVVSVASNLFPKRVLQFVKQLQDGQFDKARQEHYALSPIFHGMLSLSTNPEPIKAAMYLKGLCGSGIRLPLCELEPAQLEQVSHWIETIQES